MRNNKNLGGSISRGKTIYVTLPEIDEGDHSRDYNDTGEHNDTRRKKFTLRLPPWLQQEIEKKANHLGVPMAEYIRRILEKHLNYMDGW